MFQHYNMILSYLCLLISAVLPTTAIYYDSPPAIPSFARRKGSLHHPNYSSRRWVAAFGNPKFYTDKYISSNEPDVKLKVPNFDALFDEICKVSPLAKHAITEDKPGGIKAIDDTADVYKWKVTDSNPTRLVSHIDKIDNFQKKGCPLIRFRSSLTGPTDHFDRTAICFSELISVAPLRQKYDPTNDIVDTIYYADNLKELQEIQGDKYGRVTLFGIGYVKTKQSVVSPREQLTLCGIQYFPTSGASIIWGIELEENQNHLFPKEQTKRQPRSTSHIFSTTLVPTGENTFDVEYVLQLEVGGFPGWLTGPVVAETVKKMFSFADGYFKSGLEEGGELSQRLSLFSVEERGEEKNVIVAKVEDAVHQMEDAVTHAFGDTVHQVEDKVSHVVEDAVHQMEETFHKMEDTVHHVEEDVTKFYNGKRAKAKKFLKKLIGRK